jgi:hypothetical protein
MGSQSMSDSCLYGSNYITGVNSCSTSRFPSCNTDDADRQEREPIQLEKVFLEESIAQEMTPKPTAMALKWMTIMPKHRV